MKHPSPALPRRALGATGLEVTNLCFGTGALGSVPELFGYETPEERAVATIAAALDSPVNFLDTSAGYSRGESERRIGLAIAQRGGLPDGFVLATKVDPDQATWAYDAAAVRASIEGSLQRLGVDSVPLLYLHDPELISFEAAMAANGPVAELQRIRDEGLAAHIGVAGGPVGNLAQFIRTGIFEVLLSHNRFTLLDRTADALFDEAVERGMGVVQGAPFGGGVLAKGLDSTTLYAYQPMNAATRERIARLESICDAAGLPLGAAALQFPLRDSRIDSTVAGITRPERIEQTLDWAAWKIEPAVWQELEANAGLDAGLDNDPR
ncbi:MAG: aldo/keto reductase [Bifidobacteriaceae bacterium]|jgi:D-threo-aldose 1-dehydrogenase|nr:aldo/keto reductase [Bifidobacteriaceae bacterium]